MIAVRFAPGADAARVRADWSDIALADAAVADVVVNTATAASPERAASVDVLIALAHRGADRCEDLPGWSVLADPAAEIRAWVVQPHRPIRWARTWPDGETAPGIKMVSVMRRAPGTTREAFAEHWTQRHTPLARRHHPGLWNYTQNVVRRPLTAAGGDVDGIAELHFRSRWSFDHEFFDSDEGRAAIFADIPRFMAPPRGDGSLMIETPLRTSA